MLPEKTLQKMLALCAELRKNIDTCESVLVLFKTRPDSIKNIMELMVELGTVTSTLKIKDGAAKQYFAGTSKMLQRTDEGIAYIFCQYDMDYFEAMCNKLLTQVK